MDHQKTTHILLTIAVVGILFLIYLFMQERYFNKPTLSYQPITEEPVYVPPVNNPVNPPVTPTPTPNPTPTPTPIPTPTPSPAVQQNIPLVIGNNYNVAFGVDVMGYKYCGEKMSDFGEDVASFAYYYFVPVSNGCNDNLGPEGLNIAKKIFVAEAKPATTQNQVTALNTKYNLKQLSNNSGTYYLGIQSDSNPYNAYTLAKIYFDSGLFSSTYLDELN